MGYIYIFRLIQGRTERKGWGRGAVVPLEIRQSDYNARQVSSLPPRNKRNYNINTAPPPPPSPAQKV